MGDEPTQGQVPQPDPAQPPTEDPQQFLGGGNWLSILQAVATLLKLLGQQAATEGNDQVAQALTGTEQAVEQACQKVQQ